MTRRVSLALALALTTVVTFALVVIGTQAGLFGGKGASDTTAVRAEEPSAAPITEAPTPTQVTPAPPVVEYRTEYRYYDPGNTAQAFSPPADGQSTQADPLSGNEQSTSEHEADETPEPEATPEPRETPEPRPTPEPEETPEPHDD